MYLYIHAVKTQQREMVNNTTQPLGTFNFAVHVLQTLYTTRTVYHK